MRHAKSPALAENLLAQTSMFTNTRNQWDGGGAYGVTQPRVSDLLRHEVGVFGLDTLINMAAAAGLNVEMRVSDAV
ncbi:XRE family transcriptional regulator [Agrobacterium vitis]|uniref:XRE family transcriptional regulator n=1 Tax=Agrobacterium vitis TaxID=373 RepID=UPI00398C5A8D|nr:XRE family transcriptional regulator [Agrobacterium vitis]